MVFETKQVLSYLKTSLASQRRLMFSSLFHFIEKFISSKSEFLRTGVQLEGVCLLMNALASGEYQCVIPQSYHPEDSFFQQLSIRNALKVPAGTFTVSHFTTSASIENVATVPFTR